MTTEYDVIVVGAGSAGAAIAARLSEDPERSVLLLEAGPDYVDPETLPEDLANGLGASTDPHDWHLTATMTPGRQVPYPRGKVTGGSSAVNGIVAIRGVPEDYDEWAEWGNDEWSWEQCLPAFRKLENDQDFGGDYHGKSGPIPIVRWQENELTPLQRAWRDACRAQGFPDSDDHNAPGTTGVGSWAMNRAGSLRISTAIGYLNPARHRLNLTIRANCHVNRVLFEGERATGVEVESGGEMQTVRGREVVLAAGAVHSPAILLRSGVGPRADLEGLGIPVVHELPGVGENLVEHQMFSMLGIPRAGVSEVGQPLQQVGLRYTATGSDEENDMQAYMWHYDVKSSPRLGELAGEGGCVFNASVTLQRPKSRGRICLSSTDLNAQPEIDCNLLDDPEDRRRMLDGVRTLWRILGTEPFASVVDRFVTFDGATIDDDEAVDALLQAGTMHLVHPVGTCKMGPADDPMAVVDQHGRVHGLQSLRVADAAIMPNIPRANTNLTAIMIGERVAEFMRAGK